jgi:hypothetical protein
MIRPDRQGNGPASGSDGFDADDHVVLTDPDGNDLWLRAAPR